MPQLWDINEKKTKSIKLIEMKKKNWVEIKNRPDGSQCNVKLKTYAILNTFGWFWWFGRHTAGKQAINELMHRYYPLRYSTSICLHELLYRRKKRKHTHTRNRSITKQCSMFKIYNEWSKKTDHSLTLDDSEMFRPTVTILIETNSTASVRLIIVWHSII